mgnify:FL=1
MSLQDLKDLIVINQVAIKALEDEMFEGMDDLELIGKQAEIGDCEERIKKIKAELKRRKKKKK